MRWENATDVDQALLQKFLAAGGSSSSSIDEFVKNELLDHSRARMANSVLLVDGSGLMVGFASNAMARVPISAKDAMAVNLAIPMRLEMPVLFLHRLGVITAKHRNGYAKMLMWRTFETLAHSCTHSAAVAIALLVEPGNIAAKSLYSSMLFERVENRDKSHEMHLLSYDGAIRQIQGLEGDPISN